MCCARGCRWPLLLLLPRAAASACFHSFVRPAAAASERLKFDWSICPSARGQAGSMAAPASHRLVPLYYVQHSTYCLSSTRLSSAAAAAACSANALSHQRRSLSTLSLPFCTRPPCRPVCQPTQGQRHCHSPHCVDGWPRSPQRQRGHRLPSAASPSSSPPHLVAIHSTQLESTS